MNNIQVFSNQHFGRVRVVMRDSEPWFIAADVCQALDIGNNRQALSRLDADEKGVIISDTLGGKQSMTAVNVPGLFVLVLGSRKAEAHKFQRWITHEVLPAIRQEGAYMTPERLQEVLEDPDTLIALAQRLKLLQEKNRMLADENETIGSCDKLMWPPSAECSVRWRSISEGIKPASTRAVSFACRASITASKILSWWNV